MKKSRKFQERLDYLSSQAASNSKQYGLSTFELHWMILHETMDLLYEIKELREELRAARGEE